MRKLRHLKNIGQALVEFALAATLIFFLLAAAVDLGLIFFTVQGLHNAAQEGGAYGSRWLIGGDVTHPRTLDINSIMDRVRHESGSRGGIGFVNLLDLNNDGTRDVGPNDNSIVGAAGTTYQKMPDGTNVISNFIQIQLITDTDTDGDPTNDLRPDGSMTPCTNPQQPPFPCFIRVTVSVNYKTIFPLTPGFARVRLLHSSYVVPLRDAYEAGGTASTPAIFQTVTPLPTSTPTPTPLPIVVTITKYFKNGSSGSKPIAISATVKQGGVVVLGATVTAKIGTNTYILASQGNGTYSNCSMYSASSLSDVVVTATYSGVSPDTDSRSGSSGNFNSSGGCP